MPNDTIITSSTGDRIRIMGGEETVKQLLSDEHLETTLRSMGCTDMAAWMAQVREEDRRAEALEYLDACADALALDFKNEEAA